MLAGDYDGKVEVVNNQRISVPMIHAIWDALRLASEGKSAKGIREILEAEALQSSIYITVATLKYLKKGGRISGPASFVGGLLKIKPILHMNSEGKLVPHSKAAGRKKAIDALIDKMHKHGNGNKFGIVFISHSGPEEDAILLKEKIEANFKVDEILIEHIDPVIAAHVGYGGLALFFESKEK